MTEKEQIRQAFDALSPRDSQKNQLWERIQEGKQSRRRRRMPRVTAAAILVVVLAISGIGVNAATGGRALETIRTFCGWDPGSEEIVNRTEHLLSRGTEVYAPELFVLDEKWLVFGGRSGLLIYDREEERLAATVDVQEIDCFYFGGDSVQTHVLREGDSLILFNSENRNVFGKYYVFDLPGEEQQPAGKPEASAQEEDMPLYDAVKLSAKESGEETARLEEFYREWEKTRDNYVDTFEYFSEESFVQDYGKENTMYSEWSLRFAYAQKASRLGCLFVNGEGEYILYMKDEASGELFAEPIHLRYDAAESAEGKNEEADLPFFEYSGDDEILKAISAYYAEHGASRYYMPEGSVLVPSPLIHGQVEKEDGEILVFGDFYCFVYVRNGQLLEDCSGGGSPACIHLKKQGETYAVTEVEEARDGSYYWEDIKAFTAGYPEITEKFREEKDELLQQTRAQWLRMYVEDNGLDIKYYKDYGWDAVEIQ